MVSWLVLWYPSCSCPGRYSPSIKNFQASPGETFEPRKRHYFLPGSQGRQTTSPYGEAAASVILEGTMPRLLASVLPAVQASLLILLLFSSIPAHLGAGTGLQPRDSSSDAAAAAALLASLGAVTSVQLFGGGSPNVASIYSSWSSDYMFSRDDVR
jgi:hypothetical protein